MNINRSKKDDRNRKKYIQIAIATLLILIGYFAVWQNNQVAITEIEFIDAKVPQAFDGLRIVQLSDLHNDAFGEDQEILLSALKDSRADIIVITGDIIDKNDGGTENAMALILQAATIAPIYYVTGNHEAQAQEQYGNLEKMMCAAGVGMLARDTASITKDGATMMLFGYDEIRTRSENKEKYEEALGKNIHAADENGLTILLAHRPERFKMYADWGADIIFCGHAHGGQVRLPIINKALMAPNQGIFPKYTSGMYSLATSRMVVSRGLGNSFIPIRLFNPPEIVVVTLKAMSSGG